MQMKVVGVVSSNEGKISMSNGIMMLELKVKVSIIIIIVGSMIMK